MASRSFAAFGVFLACSLGAFTAYSTFQPELVKAEVRQGLFRESHQAEVKKQETAISDAIRQDFREAGRELKGGVDGKKGALWGIREAIWGKPGEMQQPKVQGATAVGKEGGLEDKKAG